MDQEMSQLLSILLKLLPKHQKYIKSERKEKHSINMRYFQGSLLILEYVQQELFSPTYVDFNRSVVSLPALYLHSVDNLRDKEASSLHHVPN